MASKQRVAAAINNAEAAARCGIVGVACWFAQEVTEVIKGIFNIEASYKLGFLELGGHSSSISEEVPPEDPHLALCAAL